MPESVTSATGDDYSNPYDDPLFLSNSDFTSMSLVTTPFTRKNFLNWSREVLMGVGAKNKQGFLDGSTAMPSTTSSKYQQRRRSDNMVRCWLLHALSPEIKAVFMTTKSARRLWTDLHEMYGQSNAPLLYQLKKEIKNISQSTDESIVEYYNKLKRHWDDIDDLEPYPDCTCGVMSKCTCNLLKKVLEMASQEKVITFLMGLDDSYDNLRTNILSMEPLPTINKAYSLVQQIESQKSFSKLVLNQAESSAMAVNRGKGSGHWNKPSDAKNWNVWSRNGAGTGASTGKDGAGQHKKGKRWCDHCNKSGHTRDACFILHPELRE
ncbi:uncharacterized protein LOC141587468 [Silene latifolia]|uniref:uncharacterized protein LOC141587468 n=1 Tax=Silene latifolia TaxID=37657 RepID=UPI003D771BF3